MKFNNRWRNVGLQIIVPGVYIIRIPQWKWVDNNIWFATERIALEEEPRYMYVDNQGHSPELHEEDLVKWIKDNRKNVLLEE